MGKDLHDNFACARHVFEEVDESLQTNLSRLMFEGLSSELQLTENAQPAIVAHCAALLAVLESECDVVIRPTTTAALLGHSLGEFTAYCAASVFSLADVVRLVRFRGREMQACAPNDGGKMVALFPVRGGETAVQELCIASTEKTGQVCTIANVNSSAQIVISGETTAVSWAADRAVQERVARRAVTLDTSAPFHCQLMKPAGQRLQECVKDLLSDTPHKSNSTTSKLSVPVISNTTADFIDDISLLPSIVRQHATDSVLWYQSMLKVKPLLSDPSVILCLGPGSTLQSLFKTEGMGSYVHGLDDVESVRSLLDRLS